MCEYDPYGCELDERTYCAECERIMRDSGDHKCFHCSGAICEDCANCMAEMVCEQCDAKEIAAMKLSEMEDVPVLQPIAARPVTFVYPKDDNDLILEGRSHDED